MTLLEKLKHARAARHPVTLSDTQLALRLLSEQDYSQAGLSAHKVFSEIGISATSADLYERHMANELLALAVLEPKTDEPVFSSAQELAETLSREQKSFLLEEYLTFESDHSPARMSDGEFDELLAELKKTPQTTDLNDLSSVMLRKLARSLAEQLSNC